ADSPSLGRPRHSVPSARPAAPSGRDARGGVGSDGRINVVRIRRDQAAWKERPLAVESIESAFLTGLGTAAEAAFEVQPIVYEWARAELVEQARVALIPIHLQAENRSKTSPFITPSRAKFALRHPIISQMAQTRILSGKAV